MANTHNQRNAPATQTSLLGWAEQDLVRLNSISTHDNAATKLLPRSFSTVTTTHVTTHAQSILAQSMGVGGYRTSRT
jgi:hypothetical protein